MEDFFKTQILKALLNKNYKYENFSIFKEQEIVNITFYLILVSIVITLFTFFSRNEETVNSHIREHQRIMRYAPVIFFFFLSFFLYNDFSEYSNRVAFLNFFIEWFDDNFLLFLCFLFFYFFNYYFVSKVHRYKKSKLNESNNFKYREKSNQKQNYRNKNTKNKHDDKGNYKNKKNKHDDKGNYENKKNKDKRKTADEEKDNLNNIKDAKVIEALNFFNLDYNFSSANLRSAYIKSIKVHHPDQGGSEEMTAKINNFRDILSNHIKFT